MSFLRRFFFGGEESEPGPPQNNSPAKKEQVVSHEVINAEEITDKLREKGFDLEKLGVIVAGGVSEETNKPYIVLYPIQHYMGIRRRKADPKKRIRKKVPKEEYDELVGFTNNYKNTTPENIPDNYRLLMLVTSIAKIMGDDNSINLTNIRLEPDRNDRRARKDAKHVIVTGVYFDYEHQDSKKKC